MDSELRQYIARRTEVLTRIRRMLVVSLNLRRKPDEIDPDTALFGTGLSIDSIDAVEHRKLVMEHGWLEAQIRAGT